MQNKVQLLKFCRWEDICERQMRATEVITSIWLQSSLGFTPSESWRSEYAKVRFWSWVPVLSAFPNSAELNGAHRHNLIDLRTGLVILAISGVIQPEASAPLRPCPQHS